MITENIPNAEKHFWKLQYCNLPSIPHWMKMCSYFSSFDCRLNLIEQCFFANSIYIRSIAHCAVCTYVCCVVFIWISAFFDCTNISISVTWIHFFDLLCFALLWYILLSLLLYVALEALVGFQGKKDRQWESNGFQ